jgi:hypothetical protein
VYLLKDLKSQAFYEKLTPQFQDKLSELMSQAHTVFIYGKLEFAAYVFAACLILLNYKEFFSNSFSQNAFFMIAIGGIAIAISNHLSKAPKEKLKKTSEKIKNNLIVKVCNCNGYCECKEDLVKYLKKRKIKIID